jgi:hypothetical protein
MPVAWEDDFAMENYEEIKDNACDENIREALGTFSLCPDSSLKGVFVIAKWWTLAMALLAVASSVYGYVYLQKFFFDENYNAVLGAFITDSSTCMDGELTGLAIHQETLDCFLSASPQDTVPVFFRNGYSNSDEALYTSIIVSIRDLGKDAVQFNVAKMGQYYSLYVRLLRIKPDIPEYIDLPRGDIKLVFGEFMPGIFLIYITGYVTLFLMMLCYGRFAARVPTTLACLWKRGIIHPAPGPGAALNRHSMGKELVDFVRQYQERMDDPLQSLMCGLAAGILMWRILATQNVFGDHGLGDAPLFVWLIELSQVMIGMTLGAMFWRLLVTSIFFLQMGRKFELAPQIDHPDKAGGMAVLGGLFLWNALFFVLPAIFISTWSVILLRFDLKPILEFIRVSNMVDFGLEQFRSHVFLFFSMVGILLVITSFVAFFLPLYGFHKEMEQFRDRLQEKLDALSRLTEKLKTELFNSLETIPAKEGAEQQARIELQQKILLQNRKIPTWPFDTQTILKFTAAQVGPILTLLGVSDTIVKMIVSLFAI